ncbi:transcriptional xre family [Colletotrichum higginsianum]|nr:transcriptional xre family [Colletotrichum higginsianum]
MPAATDDDSKAQRQRRNRALRERGPIAAEFEDCQQSFVRLSDALHLSRNSYLVEKCWRRFNLWDDDSGASSRTLDYNLKSSPSLVKQTTSLLHDLGWTLTHAIMAVPLEEPEDEETESGLASIKPFNNCDTALLSVDADLDNVDADVDYGTGPWLQEALDIVDNLVHLLPALRKPSEISTPEDATLDFPGCCPLQLYQEVADTMFPSADADFLNRLARTQWLNGLSLSSVHENSDMKHNANISAPTSQDQTLPRGWPSRRDTREVQAFHLLESDRISSTIRSYAETVLSRNTITDHRSTTSFGALSQAQPVRHPNVPSPPVELDQPGAGQFDCPYCHCELPLAVGTNMSHDDWASHFHQDMRPYICTFGQSRCCNVTFATREEWFLHELDFHRASQIWMCGSCAVEFRSAAEFESHLLSTHFDLPLPRDLSGLAESCKRLSYVADASWACAICRTICGSLEELENHVGNHMEAFVYNTVCEHEPLTEDDQESKDILGIVLADFLSDQIVPAAGLIGGGGDDNDDNMGTRAYAAAKPDEAVNTTRSANAGLLLDNDKANRPAAGHTSSDWTEKVTSFLGSQPHSLEAAKYNLPAQYPNFAGREQDLRRIHESLSVPGRICVLTGASGIGKTATAVQYAYRFGDGDEYAYVFWVEAEPAGLLADKYASIADALDLNRDGVQEDNSLLFRVRERLLKLDKRWLLIFDNVVSWTDISPFVTKALTLSKGSVLITTREDPRRSQQMWLHQRRIRLGPLCTDHGRELLLTSIHPHIHREDVHKDEDSELAGKIVDILEGLPLAISLVVGYVKESGCTLGDFLEMWDEKELRRMKPSKTSNTTGADAVDTTVDLLWDIGIREVPSNSRMLLNIMSFLNPDRIPKSLLVGDHEEGYLDMLNSSERLSYKRMINKLISRRLIAVKEAPNAEVEYSIHRLLKEKIILDMDDYSITDALRKTFRLIRKKFPRANHHQVPDPSTWSTCQEYMPHIETFYQIFCRERGRIEPLASVKPLELAELFYDAGFHVWSRRGTAYDGQRLLQTAIDLLDGVRYERDSKLRADINCMLGLLLLEMGCEERVEGARCLLEARRIREVIYHQHPEDHDNDVLFTNANSDYALCLMNDHQFDKAGEEMRRCFGRYEVWGPQLENPFENSKYYGNYSVVLMFQGRMDEAIGSVERCLELTQRFSGKKAQWYRRVFLLASIHLQAGDVQKALDLHLETLAARFELGGKHNTNFILSLYAVGATYHHLKNLEQATQYMNECVEYATNAQWSKVGIGRAKLHLATLYEEQGLEDKKVQTLKAEARKVLEEYRSYAAECVQSTNDELMIFDDLQPTLLGRYTGTALLKHLQANLPRRRPCSLGSEY